MPVLLILPVFSTLAGGLFAVRLHRKLTLLTALSAGLLLGAALLDMLPEAISLASGSGFGWRSILAFAALSFLSFQLLEAGTRAAAERWKLSDVAVGRVGGALLIFHSLRDGMAIGLSFAASHEAGYAVAAGIAAHDLGDGLNTVLITTRGKRARGEHYGFLAADSLAPLAGALMTVHWRLSASASAILLALAAGFFLHFAVRDSLPKIWRREQERRLALSWVAIGAALIYGTNVLVDRFH